MLLKMTTKYVNTQIYKMYESQKSKTNRPHEFFRIINDSTNTKVKAEIYN